MSKKKCVPVILSHVLVCVGICWQVLACVGICWHVLICVDVCWYMLVLCWNALVCVGMRWFRLEYVGMCWYVLVCVGTCWYALVCAGFMLECVGSVANYRSVLCTDLNETKPFSFRLIFLEITVLKCNELQWKQTKDDLIIFLIL